MRADIIVIGAGTVGAAIAYGLAGRGQNIIALDGSDSDLRAARANFGLIWQQGKGANMPAYQLLTRRSVVAWREFARELEDLTGIDLEYEANGGVTFCFGEEAWERRRDVLSRSNVQCGGGDGIEMLRRTDLEKLMPRVPFGPDVTGVSFGRNDGHVNPLKLLSALHAGLDRRGGRLLRNQTVTSVVRDADGFKIKTNDNTFTAGRVVFSAGLGTAALASQVGLDVPIGPERGQILVTERLQPFLPLPASGLRQTRDGTVMIGATKENVGLDTSATVSSARALSANATRTVPKLAEACLVRQWGGLRILSPDGCPIYAESVSCPGAFVTTCHSGVTLAAMHATSLAAAVASGHLSAEFDPFHHGRFDVPKVA